MIRYLATVAAFCVATSLSGAHAATTINVTTTDMTETVDGRCSLVEALLAVSVQSTVDTCVVGPGKGPYTIVLGSNQVYTATSTEPVNNHFYYGPSLYYQPALRDIEIIGNGSVIQRDPAAPKFRFFFVADGSLTLRDLTLRNGDIQGATTWFDDGGAIALDRALVNLDRVTFDGSIAGYGAAVVVTSASTLNVLSSTFMHSSGAGTIYVSSTGNLNLANSTFSQGGGDVVTVSSGTVMLSHNTFFNMVGAYIPGSIVARGNVFYNCAGSGAITGSLNEGSATCPGAATDDRSSLQPLADNGGPTETRAFLAPSPFLDSDPTCTFLSSGVNPLFTNGAPITTDQRGVARTAGACDMGAFEENSGIRLASALPGARQGLPYAAPLAGAGGSAPYAFSLVSGPSWASVTNVGTLYTLRGTPPSGHGTTVNVVLRIADATGLASYRTYPLFIASGVSGAPTLTGSSFNVGTGTETVTFTPPADDGGGPISDYHVKCASPAFQSTPSVSSPLVFSVPSGPAYSGCAVYANNGSGESPGSAGTFIMSASVALVTSITRASANPAAPNSRIDFNVTFNRPVTNVLGPDFSLVVGGGITGAVNTGVVGSGINYVVTVYTGSGFGTLTLNFVDRDLVFDSGFTPVGGTGLNNGDFAGPTYTVASPPSTPTITGLYPTNAAIVVQYTPSSANGSPLLGYEATCNPGARTSARSFPLVLEVTVPVINGQQYTCTVTAFNGAGPSIPSAPMVVDVPAVAVTNIKASTPPPNPPGSIVEFTVTFSYPVTGVDVSDFFLTTSGVTGASIVSVSGFDGLYKVTVNTGTGFGTVRLDMVDDDSIRDATSVPLYGVGTGLGSSGESYRIFGPPDAPVITTITPGVGIATIVFAPPASDGGSPITGYQATCNPGAVTSAAALASPITITLPAGSYTCTMVAINAGGPGAVSNAVGVTMSPPSVTGITAAGTTPTAAATIAFDVTFSVPVTGVDPGDFTLVTTGGITGASVASVTGTGASYQVTVNTGASSGSIRLDLVDNDSITDGASPLGGAGAGNGNAQGPVYSIDRTVPLVQSIVVVGGSPGPVRAGTVVAYDVTFTRNVTGVDTSDFSTNLTGSAAAAIGAITGGGSVYRVTYTVNGSGTVRVVVLDDDSIADTLGNKLGGTGAGNGAYLSGPLLTIDGTAPSVTAITRNAAVNAAAGSSVGFTVRFSEAVTGVDAGDFRLVASGTATGTVSSMAGSGDTYTVTISIIGGGGTLRLDLADDDSIADAAGLKLGGTGAGNGDLQGQAYTVATPLSSHSDISPTGTGTITATLTGGGPACTFATSQFIAVTGDAQSPPAGTAPAAFPHGLFDFTLGACTPGATITMTIVYPAMLPVGTQYYKYGPTASNPTPHWYVLPATIVGNTVIFSITDGGLGDDDLTANGTIVDQGGPGAPGSARQVPTLSPWAMLLLTLMMAACAWAWMRRAGT
jgi:hypothetical protein